MNGAAHYREAERLIVLAAGLAAVATDATAARAFAQVHATLALAAATIDTSNRRASDADDWSEAIR